MSLLSPPAGLVLVLMILNTADLILVTVGETIDGDKVSQLRKRLLAEYEAHVDLYDPVDIEECRNETWDWPVRRYLAYDDGDLERAFGRMKSNLQWRKETSLNQLTAKDWPCEFIYNGIIKMIPKDRKGRPVFLWDLTYHRSYPDVLGHYSKYTFWLFDLFDKLAGERGWGMIAPMHNVGAQNFDVQYSMSLFSLVDRFTGNLQYILIHEPVFVLGQTLKLLMTWMPDRLRTRVRVSEDAVTRRFVSKRVLPIWMGGSYGRSYAPPALIPNRTECRNIWEVARELQWPKSSVETYLSVVSGITRKNRRNDKTQ